MQLSLESNGQWQGLDIHIPLGSAGQKNAEGLSRSFVSSRICQLFTSQSLSFYLRRLWVLPVEQSLTLPLSLAMQAMLCHPVSGTALRCSKLLRSRTIKESSRDTPKRDGILLRV